MRAQEIAAPDRHARPERFGSDSCLCVGFQVEGVLHVARRVVGRDVQGLEIVKIVFNFRAVRADKAQGAEDGDERIHHLGERMQMAIRVRRSRQRDVQGVFFQGRRPVLCARGFFSLAARRASRLVLSSLSCGPKRFLSSMERLPSCFRRSGQASFLAPEPARCGLLPARPGNAPGATCLRASEKRRDRELAHRSVILE